VKRFAIETAWIAAACLVYFLAYYLVERRFGDEARWAFIAVSAVAVAGYLFLRRRK